MQGRTDPEIRMHHSRNLSAAPVDSEKLDQISESASRLSFETVEMAVTIYQIDQNTGRLLEMLQKVNGGARRMLDGNTAVQRAISAVGDTITTTLGAVEKSVAAIRGAGSRVEDLAAWVQSLDARITAIEETLESTRASNASISAIASQVNILAINAKIEAARAGDAGRGFAVVAEAINDLSHKTAGAAEGIDGNITSLVENVSEIRQQANEAAQNAGLVLNEAGETNQALTAIASHVQTIHNEANAIHSSATQTGAAIEEFQVSFSAMGGELEDTASGIRQMRAQSNKLVDRAENMVQLSVGLGGHSPDARMIDEINALVAQVARAFEAGLRNGLITQQELFSQTYTPIPGTNPEQLMAPFTKFTDKVLPPIQEPALDLDERVVFCAAVDTNGYLPTHNLKFSKPQGPDPDWNMANCRNRRLFNDRVGLKAGRNTEPFLLQIYRRNMGGGKFVIMKDLSAPIFVQGRHWGAIRLAYTI